MTASKPQVLENCPVLGSRIALLFKWLKFCRSAEKCFSRPFFLEIDGKNFFRPFFLGKHLHLCPWSLASSIPVLGFFVSLASSLVSSTPPLLISCYQQILWLITQICLPFFSESLQISITQSLLFKKLLLRTKIMKRLLWSDTIIVCNILF